MEVRWFGADWDSKKCVVAFEKNGRIHRRRVKRHPDAVAAFLAEFGPIQARVGIECGDRLWPRLWRQAGAEVWVFDAKKAKRYGESLHASGASDDKRSAQDLLVMVQNPPHRAQSNSETPADVRARKRLLVMADVASKEVTRCENRLGSHLREVHPALELALARSFQAAWFLRAVQLAPTAKAWRELSEEAQAAALKGSSKKNRPRLLVAFGEDWGALDPQEEEAARLHIRTLAHALKAALAIQKQVTAALKRALEASPVNDTIKSVKRLGPFIGTATSIVLELAIPGDRDSMAVQLAAAPVTRRSGTTGDRQPSVRLRRAAAPTMRKASYLLGFQLVGAYRWAKAQYAFHRARGKKAAGAYRRVVRSFLRILGALHRDKAKFDENRYIEALKRKGVKWAMALDTDDLDMTT